MARTNTQATPPSQQTPAAAGLSAEQLPIIPPPDKSVAIVGTDESGKTVLLTVLAHKLENTKSATWLDCLNKEAIRFKERNWDILVSQDWPAGSGEGTNLSLDFCLHTTKGAAYPFQALDFSGQNFRKLFVSRLIDQPEELLPENLRTLATHLKSAHIVVVLIKLSDFMDVVDPGIRADNEFALKSYLDYLKLHRRYVCIALSQTDRYRSTITSLGGPIGAIEEYLKQIYNAHVKSNHVQVFSVAAVADKVKVASHGELVREVPAPDFSSEGIDELVNWIGQSADALRRRERCERVIEQIKRYFHLSFKYFKRALPICAAIAVILLLIRPVVDYLKDHPIDPVKVVDVEVSPKSLTKPYESRTAHIQNNDSRTLYVTVRLHYAGIWSGPNPKDFEDRQITIPAKAARTVEFRLWPGQDYGSITIEKYR